MTSEGERYAVYRLLSSGLEDLIELGDEPPTEYANRKNIRIHDRWKGFLDSVRRYTDGEDCQPPLVNCVLAHRLIQEGMVKVRIIDNNTAKGYRLLEITPTGRQLL